MVSDEKWLRYEAAALARRNEITMDEALGILFADPRNSNPEGFVACPDCGVKVKGKNVACHQEKHRKGPKINWGEIPIIKKQRNERKRITNAVGKQKINIVSGGAPSLGKKK